MTSSHLTALSQLDVLSQLTALSQLTVLSQFHEVISFACEFVWIQYFHNKIDKNIYISTAT